MKKFYTIVLLVVILFSMPFSCKEITSSENLFPLTPANIDANAGTWKPIVLTTNNQIGVPAPTAVTSDAYKAELASNDFTFSVCRVEHRTSESCRRKMPRQRLALLAVGPVAVVLMSRAPAEVITREAGFELLTEFRTGTPRRARGRVRRVGVGRAWSGSRRGRCW